MDLLAEICNIEYQNKKRKRDNIEEKYNKKKKLEATSERIFYVNVSNNSMNLILSENTKIKEYSGINNINCKNFYQDNLFKYVENKSIIKNKDCIRYIRFLKVEVDGVERVYVTRDIFSLIKITNNISRDSVRKCKINNNYDILYVKIPSFNFNVDKGQSQYIFSIDALQQTLGYYIFKFPDFVKWVMEEVIPYMKKL
jgi:hypothetical protein